MPWQLAKIGLCLALEYAHWWRLHIGLGLGLGVRLGLGLGPTFPVTVRRHGQLVAPLLDAVQELVAYGGPVHGRVILLVLDLGDAYDLVLAPLLPLGHLVHPLLGHLLAEDLILAESGQLGRRSIALPSLGSREHWSPLHLLHQAATLLLQSLYLQLELLLLGQDVLQLLFVEFSRQGGPSLLAIVGGWRHLLLLRRWWRRRTYPLLEVVLMYLGLGSLSIME